MCECVWYNAASVNQFWRMDDSRVIKTVDIAVTDIFKYRVWFSYFNWNS